jgi:hypothetical protein
MLRRSRTFLFLTSLLLFSVAAFSQTAPVKNAAPQKTAKSEKAASPARERRDPLAEQRRNTAISLLTSLADEAKSYHNLDLRARVLARAADAIWSSDAERARALFYRAWEAVMDSAEEAAQRTAADLDKQEKNPHAPAPMVIAPSSNIRNEVLRLAARHDRALGEEFLKKSEEAEKLARDESPSNRPQWLVSASQSQRLKLATQLLQEGDTERAVEYADTALVSVGIASIDFLSSLRQQNAAAADQRYAAMLGRALTDPSSDANTVSTLSSYAFTPFLYIVFQPGGGASQIVKQSPLPAPDLPPALRKAFFQTASQILLRPLPPPEQDKTSAGRVGKYLVMRRLLPLYTQYAPEQAADLRVQMMALMSDVPEGQRTGENRAVTRGIVPEDNSRDPMRRMEERLSQAETSAERDGIYADMASSLAGANDARGRDLIEKIEDTELRQQTRAYTDFEYMSNAIQKNDVPELIRIARTGELTHIQRVFGLTQAARLSLKPERERAVELLEEALGAARRIGGSDADRPRALTAVSSVFVEADRSRAWELLSEIVKAGNSADGFTGDDPRITALLRFNNGAVTKTLNAADFDLLGVFRALSKIELYPAIEAAKNFTGEVPRANAILAIARTVLEEKQAK